MELSPAYANKAKSLVLVVESALPGVRLGLYGPGVCASLALAEARGEQLAELLQDLLFKTGGELSQVSKVVASCGPGSFTGLRAGLAFCAGLCFSEQRTLHGASTLQFLRLCARHSKQALILLPARSDAYFVAWPEGGETLVETAQLLNFSPQAPWAVFGPTQGLPPGTEDLREKLDLEIYAREGEKLPPCKSLMANYIQEFRIHRRS